MEEKEKTRKELIMEQLTKNVDLSAEEYREMVKKADEITAKHGATQKAPISESVRHKRIEMNFMAMLIEYNASILTELVYLRTLVQSLLTAPKGEKGENKE